MRSDKEADNERIVAAVVAALDSSRIELLQNSRPNEMIALIRSRLEYDAIDAAGVTALAGRTVEPHSTK